MTQSKPRTADSPAHAVRVSECRGGGFVVSCGSEVYAACASPYDVAHAMAALLAERDDGAAETPPAALPIPARSGTDPVPEGIRPDGPPDMQPNGDMTERLRATAGMALMALMVCVRAVVGV